MPASSIILAGAPRSSSLTWEEPILLNNECWFCLTENNVFSTHPSRWRVVASFDHSLRNSVSGEGNVQTSFLRMGAIERYTGLQESLSQQSGMLSNFYDHSFALHEGVHSSALSHSLSYDDTEINPDESSEDTRIDHYSTTQPDDGRSKENRIMLSIRSSHLSDLEDIPSATYLLSVAPQTIVVNLIVAVITILPRKRVRTRWGYYMDIVEVVVGDETRSGFGVTCWLPAVNEPGPRPSNIPLEQSLAEVRPRDIVIFRSVALGTFRGQVYGQSIRHNKTTIDILYRTPVDLTDNVGVLTDKTMSDITNNSDRLLAKVHGVRDWISNFTGPGLSDCLAKRDGRQEQSRPVCLLPPDTQ